MRAARSEVGSLSMNVGAIDWTMVALALALLVLAVGLLVLEFFVVSFGLLLSASLASVGGAIYYAFSAGPVVGWLFVIIVPAIAYLVTRWGVQRIQNSRLVTRAESSGEAGYHHALDRINVAVGSVGEMVTMARPTGRARFAGGECDVQVRGKTLERGAGVVVKEVDGPVVFVVAAQDAAHNG
jgi:membrane-bound ClpP family serine protease